MIAQRVIDVSDLRTYEISSEAPLWWGQVFLAVIEGAMFAILIAMYFYIRLSLDMWPPPGVQLPPELLPALSVVVLVGSCAGSYLASEAAKRDDRRGMLRGLALNLLLAGIAMVLRAISWREWNFKWTTGAYGSITWTIMFLHTVDVAADLVFTIVLAAIVLVRGHDARTRLGVHVDSIVWYFLVAIWIPLYVTLYWGPHLVGAP